jgi:hypothetical protein
VGDSALEVMDGFHQGMVVLDPLKICTKWFAFLQGAKVHIKFSRVPKSPQGSKTLHKNQDERKIGRGVQHDCPDVNTAKSLNQRPDLCLWDASQPQLATESSNPSLSMSPERAVEHRRLAFLGPTWKIPGRNRRQEDSVL